MDEAEVRAMRREILDDVGAILREELAAGEWGRVLVEVVRGPDGAPVVSGIDVDELFGDEARVDETFGGEGVRGVLPVLAKAVEALCALDELDLDDVRGGTFVRMPDERFGWLPSLVRAPRQRSNGHRSRSREGSVAGLRPRSDARAGHAARHVRPSSADMGLGQLEPPRPRGRAPPVGRPPRRHRGAR